MNHPQMFFNPEKGAIRAERLPLSAVLPKQSKYTQKIKKIFKIFLENAKVSDFAADIIYVIAEKLNFPAVLECTYKGQ